MKFFLISEILLHFLDVGLKKLKLALDEMFQRQRNSLSFSHLYIYKFASALLLISFFVVPPPPPLHWGSVQTHCSKTRKFCTSMVPEYMEPTIQQPHLQTSAKTQH
jgi:hypothetical protein